jgi:hypothetical protein
MNTEAKSADDILGYEFDWLARDADDHVARVLDNLQSCHRVRGG